MKIPGKVALVTGASRGVGRAIAVELARRGADLILTARDRVSGGMSGTLDEAADEVRALGREARVVRADLSESDSLAQLASEAVAWRGRVDVLINNAAFLGRAAYYSLDEMDLKNWSRQLAVNLTAPMLLAKALAPSMRAVGGGAIVNITSGASLIGEYTVPGIAYGPTKAALDRLTTLLARDLRADGIAVFAVDPGYTRTQGAEQTADAVGLDVSDAHDPGVPAAIVADLVAADSELSTGRVFKTVAGKGPVLMADAHVPRPEGVEIQL